MKLRMLKNRPEECEESRGGRPSLRVVDGSTQIIEWPYPVVESLPNGGVEVKAEVHTKRFHDRSVDSERYTATVRAKDNSPYAIMSALVEACGSIEEFRYAGASDDQVILQISLRG
ncbi:MAG TPA: hypothetical protein VKB09_01750 [Thermomicrobiales bacterium]|nr:hypothetical protein [Thermomicrobiales bacterium]